MPQMHETPPTATSGASEIVNLREAIDGSKHNKACPKLQARLGITVSLFGRAAQ